MRQPLKIMMIIAIALIQCVMRTASVCMVLRLDANADACGFAIKVPSPSVAPLSARSLRIHYQIPALAAMLCCFSRHGTGWRTIEYEVENEGKIVSCSAMVSVYTEK